MVFRVLLKFSGGVAAGVGTAAIYIQSKYVAMDDACGDALLHLQNPKLGDKHARSLAGYPVTYYTEGSLREQPLCAPPLREHVAKEVDVCIVGGGFAGLHTALALSEKGKSVVVLEARRVGCKASGRNGGDAIIGFHTEADEIAQLCGEAAAREIYGHSIMGYERLKSIIANYNIKCGAKEEGAVTVVFKRRLEQSKIPVDKALEEEREYAKSVKERFGEELEVWDKAALEKHGFVSDRFSYGVFNPKNIAMNPLEMVLGLARACKQKGAEIYEASPVTSCTKLPRALHHKPGSASAEGATDNHDVDRWLVTTEMGSLVAKNVVLATNGIPAHLSLKLNLATSPLVTAMMLTKPIDKTELDKVMSAKCAVFDERFALAYFRRVEGNRILFGALARGTPMDRTWAQQALVSDLTATFPSLKGLIEPDVHWQGRLEAKLPVFPLIGRESSGMWYSFGYSGHGLVPTCAAGELLASAIASLDVRKDGSKPKPDERYKLWGLVNYGPASHNVPSFLPPTLLPVGGPLGMVISPLYCKYAELKDSYDNKI